MIYGNNTQSQEVEAIENENINEATSKEVSIRPKKFQQKYLVPHLESYLWDQSLNELMNAGKFDVIRKMANENAELYLDDYKIMSLVNAMGCDNMQERSNELFERLKNSQSIAQVYMVADGLHVDKVDGTKIHARVLSDIMPNLFEGDDRIKTKARKAGNGHYDSINLSTSLNIDNNVVTGFVYGLTSRSRYLHSWVEARLDGEDVVIDYTMNVIMNRDGYYELKKAEPISKVRDYELREDGKAVYPYILKGELTYAEYLACRKEVMENINSLQSEN